ncbi:bile acid:sodium symporter family protein [Hymenobacter properus]|uniref:Bile acid:sodium symporter family protein n=1 Tax=Hymenobacter properus TaxID=2791026 RepID=A0A931BC63_9BACT|nr:bile acid:sodium symporter family protein [Hymenobacter properus]MBF9141084.1 bile acid:sodium symporter family protein [Hymenobacter properus]MBR7719893.1 bile acid:sodium symporter family protein [Microvirga sp. SRT04]
MNRLFQLCLLVAGLAGVVLLIGISQHNAALWQPAAVVAVVGLALGLKAVPLLRSYQYTAWIIVAVVAGLVYPGAFKQWGGVDLRHKWLILAVVQLVMFGMGIQMSIRDFSGLGSTGKGVLIGLLCHFSVMPLMGLLLTRVFHFEPEIAAGIILIGSCSSGLASNVMVYLARANMVLSVVVTAMATLAAPFLTPLLLKLLAGTLIEVKFVSMMMEIIKIVLVPIMAALLHDYLKTAPPQGRRVVGLLAGAGALWLVALPLGLWAFLERRVSSPELLQALEILSFLVAAVVVGVLYHQAAKKLPRIDAVMPYLSMFGIIYFTAVTTAAGHDNLLRVGFLLFLASVLHNAAGYFFGYWLSRLFGLDVNSARTVAFEVGLQNGGMASGLAGSMGKLGTVGLPAAVFSPWMNISGSILANYWRKRPVMTPSLTAAPIYSPLAVPEA